MRWKCRHCGGFSFSRYHKQCLELHLQEKRQRALDWMHVVASAGIKTRKEPAAVLADMEVHALAAGLKTDTAHDIFIEVAEELGACYDEESLGRMAWQLPSSYSASFPGRATRVETDHFSSQ